jgi:hypothetical protein
MIMTFDAEVRRDFGIAGRAFVDVSVGNCIDLACWPLDARLRFHRRQRSGQP